MPVKSFTSNKMLGLSKKKMVSKHQIQRWFRRFQTELKNIIHDSYALCSRWKTDVSIEYPDINKLIAQ